MAPTLHVTKKHHSRLNNPFPPPPKGLPIIRGTLLHDPISLSSPLTIPIGSHFILTWTPQAGGSISLSSTTHPTRPLLSSLPGEPFISAAAAGTSALESRGSISISDTHLSLLSPHQSLHDITSLDDSCLISGELSCNTNRFSSPFSLLLSQETPHQVSFHVTFGGFKVFNRVIITLMSEEREKIYGFGEQFSRMEFKGFRVPILVQEQGIGRGDQPITFAANLVSHRSGGDWTTTYAPSPFFVTSTMKAAFLEGHDYSVFDMREPDRIQIQIYGHSAKLRVLDGRTPLEILERFTETVGRKPELPPWILSGAVVGMQGGTKAVVGTWEKLKDYGVPISAFWLQDWVGQRETVIGSQLWWNWEVDEDRYPRWSDLVGDLKEHGIRVMGYCNPCLAPTDGKPNRKRNLFKEANALDILVKDQNGLTYLVPNTAFDVGMIDFTHPSAEEWFKKILQEMVDCGLRGWMADFGEGLPLDAKLYSGEDPISAHNRYPEMWAKVNRDFTDSFKLSSNKTLSEEEDDDSALVFFMRAGFRDSPKWAMLFWEGDQMVSWQKNDGIKSSVLGLLSGGLSGFSLNHSDIGGYCSVNVPGVRYLRSEELLLRWMEVNAFTTIFRTHEGNKPSSNCQFYSNHKTLAHFARFAKVYLAWKFYRIRLVKEASQRGIPVVRHLFLHYPEDERVQDLTYQQFLVGSEIMVAPVVDQGRGEVRVYFPGGEETPWRHVWSGREFGGGHGGAEARVEAPLGYPAVFVRCGSAVGEEFVKNLRDLKVE